MYRHRWKCKKCGKGLSFATVWVDNGGNLCLEHAKEVRRSRYGGNEELLPLVKAMAIKDRRNAA